MKLTAKPPYQDKAKRTIEKVVKAAHYKDVETGKFEIKEIEDEHGNRETVKKPITERVFVEAVREVHETEVDVWIVETQFGEDGEIEKHEFADEAGAQNYYGVFK